MLRRSEGGPLERKSRQVSPIITVFTLYCIMIRFSVCAITRANTTG